MTMKALRPRILACVLLLAAVPALAQSAAIEGQIVKVDPSAGKITIKHGPIPKLGMDQGMTMVFKAQDPAMLTAVKAGDKVKFDATQVDGEFTVTAIEKTR
jgi:Cu(I)/Ag(I) efflux system periplasmic protein CusF